MTKREMAAMVREYELRLAPAGYTMLLGEIIASYGDPCLLISSPEGDEPISDAEYDEIREAYEDLSAAQRAYTYSIYSADLQAGSSRVWSGHDDAEIRAESDAAATEAVRVTEMRDGYAWVVTADLLDAGTPLTLNASQIEPLTAESGWVHKTGLVVIG